MLHDYIPNYVEPTPEEIAQHQAENASRLAEIETRNQRITDILDRLGGHKTTELDSLYTVFYCIDSFRTEVGIEYEGKDEYVGLNPRAALKLLAWLEQERETLEEWAKYE